MHRSRGGSAPDQAAATGTSHWSVHGARPTDGVARLQASASAAYRFTVIRARVMVKSVKQIESAQRRYRLGITDDELAEQEVEDAWNATAEERMAAAVTLLDTAFQLWVERGLDGDQGLCRVPRCTQQRRRLVRRDRGDGGARARPLPDDA